MRGRTRLALLSATLATLLLAASPALAEDTAAARVRFEEAKRAFRAGRYAEAAEAYERSAAAHPHPAPLVNAAEAWELDGNLVRAVQACDRALLLKLEPKLRDSLERRVARLARSIGTVTLRGSPGLGASVDGGELVSPPARIRVSPGRHRLTYVDSESRREVDDDMTIAAGEERAIVLSQASLEKTAAGAGTSPVAVSPSPLRTPPAPPAPGAEPAPDRSGGGPPLGSWLAFGLGGAAGATGAVFGVMTMSAKSEYERLPSVETLDSFEQKRLLTNVAVGVAAAAIVVGLVVWIVQPQKSSVLKAGGQALDLVAPRF